MMQHKRCGEQSRFIEIMPKRSKTADAPPLSSKEKKEKVSERISVLQQLVSPYGKTDTASVLLEAMEYIRFLHEQVKVLSAPYLSTELQGDEVKGLKGMGLCLVPMSLTVGAASSNGADIWAPIKTSPANPSHEASGITQS